MNSDDKLSRVVLLYGGIKYSQKHISEMKELSDDKKEKTLGILKEQEKILDSILRTKFKDDDSKMGLAYQIFLMCQKDIYSVV